ncbi:MAG TPA: hypothetical protein VHG35_12615 [Gemmatimonadales bacterium]|nr:hypothetical protein [Gemmatimonadales bacterium]
MVLRSVGYFLLAGLLEIGGRYLIWLSFFIVLSLTWGWAVDGHRPDRWDYLGGALCVFGMALIMYGPRSGAA